MQHSVIDRVGADDRDASRPLAVGGERAFGDQRGGQMNDIGNWSIAQGRKRSAATRSKTWGWVVGPAAIPLAALLWGGFSYPERAPPSPLPIPPPPLSPRTP